MSATNRDVPERRIALVVGNGGYLHSDTLRNPRNDAAATSTALRQLGFSVIDGYDLGHDEVESLFSHFERELVGSDVGLFYYSGHGLQIDNVNYLVPVDADIDSAAFLSQIISIQDLMRRVSGRTGLSLVFLDACRNNPFAAGVNERRESYSPTKDINPVLPLRVGQGLAQLSRNEEAFRGQMFVAFAAAPGEVAYESDGELSFFTDGLVEHIETTDLSLDHLMTRVREHVQTLTKERQKPWGLSSLRKTFYFNPGTLVWLNANIVSFCALFVAFFVYSFVLASNPGALWIIPIVAMLAVTFVLLLLGLQRSFRFLRGDFKGLQEDLWQRSILAGYFGGIFAAPVVATSYYLSWLRSSQLYGWEPPEPFAVLLTEITIASVVTGIVLGPASYVMATRPFGLRNPSAASRLLGGIAGGILAGFIVGPPMTLYFGLLARPPVSEGILIPGGLFGAVILVFSIVTYNIESISYRTMRRDALVSLFATLFVAAVAGLILFALSGWMEGVINEILGTRDKIVLLVAGLAIGTAVGAILGSVISLALLMCGEEEGQFRWPWRSQHEAPATT